MEGKGGGLADHLRRSTDVQLAYAEESEVWVLLLTEATPVRSSLVFGWCACRNRGQGSLCIQAFYPSASIFIGAGWGGGSFIVAWIIGFDTKYVGELFFPAFWGGRKRTPGMITIS